MPSPCIDYAGGLVLVESHRSTSDRNHPPATCFCGKSPFLIQRNTVERFTPTIRNTSRVGMR